jgi:uncharacterized protein YuzE
MTIEYDPEADLAYFHKKLERGLRTPSAERIRKQIELLEDAVIIYRLDNGITDDVKEWMKFGFTKEEAAALMHKYRFTHSIPKSFLVQTFMGKLRDELDRR